MTIQKQSKGIVGKLRSRDMVCDITVKAPILLKYSYVKSLLNLNGTVRNFVHVSIEEFTKQQITVYCLQR